MRAPFLDWGIVSEGLWSLKLLPQALSQRKSPSSSSDTHFIPGKRQEMLLSWPIPLLFQAVGNEQVFEPMALMPCDGLDITWSTSQRWLCPPILNCSQPMSRCYGNVGCMAATWLPVLWGWSCPLGHWRGVAGGCEVLGGIASPNPGLNQASSSSGCSGLGKLKLPSMVFQLGYSHGGP